MKYGSQIKALFLLEHLRNILNKSSHHLTTTSTDDVFNYPKLKLNYYLNGKKQTDTQYRKETVNENLVLFRRGSITYPKSLSDISKTYPKVDQDFRKNWVFFSDMKTCRTICLYVRNTIIIILTFSSQGFGYRFGYTEGFSDLL